MTRLFSSGTIVAHMAILDAIILGVVQGLTEFLPVSSSGHLVLAHQIFGFATEGGLAFDAVLHFATALAVLLYFWRDIYSLLRTVPRLGQFRTDNEVRLALALAVATVPAVILGLLLEDFMATVFRNPLLVACTLVIGAGVIWYAEKRGAANSATDIPPVKGGIIVGLFQSLALVPGMSRSGMAISGAMYLGLTRAAATRFAFLFAVPLLLGAGAKKILDIADGAVSVGNITPLVVGAIAAFLTGLLVIHYFLRFVRTHSLMPFVWYRLVLAVAVLVGTLL